MNALKKYQEVMVDTENLIKSRGLLPDAKMRIWKRLKEERRRYYAVIHGK